MRERLTEGSVTCALFGTHEWELTGIVSGKTPLIWGRLFHVVYHNNLNGSGR
jgi:hypothetical protein